MGGLTCVSYKGGGAAAGACMGVCVAVSVRAYVAHAGPCMHMCEEHTSHVWWA